MRTLLTILAAIVSLLISPVASAQFNQHYRETTLNFGTGFPDIQYITIPRISWPINVQISGVDLNARPIVLTNFAVVDSPFVGDNPTMTMASTGLALGTAQGASVSSVCSYPAPQVPASAECQITSEVSVGVTDTSSAQPHKIFIRFPQAPDQTQFHITMWY